MLGRPPGSWFQPDAPIDGRVRRRLKDEIMIALAGPEAQSHVSTKAAVQAGAGFDWPQAADLALYVAGSDLEAEAFVEWLRLRTANLIIGQPLVWACTEALATRLIEKSMLKGRDMRETISATCQDALAPRRERLKRIVIVREE